MTAPVRILAASSPGEVRAAAAIGGELLDFAIWRPGRPDGVGDVYRARVTARVPGMAGAFVALPRARSFQVNFDLDHESPSETWSGGDGFLPDSEGAAAAVEGALLTVRITRGRQGGKGARLSAKLTQTEGSPGLVARGPSPVEDLAARFPDAPIAVDDPALAALLLPIVGRRIEVVPDALESFADAIDALAAREVALPGGMRASIDPTPALVAIDLDMAKATEGRQPKAGAQLAANLAALPALARQIRLRNLSGAILVDPAGMSAKRRVQLGPGLDAALADDPLRPKLLGFTALGLAEIVRPRVRPPLHELLAGPHAAGIAALRALARESAAAPHAALRLHAAMDVATTLEQDEIARADLARRTGRPLTAKSDPALPPGAWRIERDK